MDAQSISSISAGLLIYSVLSTAEGVAGKVSRIFPVAITAEDVKLPFIVYRTVKQEPTAAKPQRGYDSCLVAVDCVASSYGEAVKLAESVRAVLEESSEEKDGIAFSLCAMTDREEFYEADAFVERLIFTISV